jgi:hypothetical protein
VKVVELSSGTVPRTVSAFGAIPIVTRLDLPEDFGDLQLRLLAVFAPFALVGLLCP